MGCFAVFNISFNRMPVFIKSKSNLVCFKTNCTMLKLFSSEFKCYFIQCQQFGRKFTCF